MAAQVQRGARIERSSETQAVLVYGKPVNHVLHLLLSLVTLGFWIVVWIAAAVLGGEARSVVTLREDGSIRFQRQGLLAEGLDDFSDWFGRTFPNAARWLRAGGS